MPCLLDIRGSNLDLEKTLSLVSFTPYATHRRGEAMKRKPMRSHDDSGLRVEVSSTAAYSTWFLSASSRTTATVREIIERKDAEGQVSLTTTYTYQDSTGTSHTGETSLSGGGRSTTGGVIPVRYLDNSPDRSRIDTFLHHWFAPIFLLGWSILAGALGIWLRWWRRREQQWADKRLRTTGTAGHLHE